MQRQTPPVMQWLTMNEQTMVPTNIEPYFAKQHF
jgi:hypothetical protein